MSPTLTTSPDPDTRTPRFECPPGTVDTHIHLFGPAEKYAWDPGTYYVARDATPEMRARTIPIAAPQGDQPSEMERLDTWGQATDALALMRAVKNQFDPKNTLNPGRFVGGI